MSRVSFKDATVVGVKVTLNVNEAPAARFLGRLGAPLIENGLLFPAIPMFDITVGRVPVLVTVNGIEAV
jgi:hypothetical protein